MRTLLRSCFNTGCKTLKMSRGIWVGIAFGVVLSVSLLFHYHTHVFTNPPTRCIYRGSAAGKDGIITDNGILPPAPNELTIKDITVTIKTGHKLAGRLDSILLTWCPQAEESVIYITDSGSLPLRLRSKSLVVETTCDTDHSAEGLNCKMEAEFEAYMKRRTKWWCHMDDDNYVNTDVLLRLLSKYDPESDVYIGRSSLDYPQPYTWRMQRVAAWFAHGGCGFCVSRALAIKMNPYISGGGLINISKSIHANDDCAVGFIINYLLNTELTLSTLFNSHFHYCELADLTLRDIKRQATLSYSVGSSVRITRDDLNSTRGFFSTTLDPSRFFTVHCLLHPETDYCLNAVF